MEISLRSWLCRDRDIMLINDQQPFNVPIRSRSAHTNEKRPYLARLLLMILWQLQRALMNSSSSCLSAAHQAHSKFFTHTTNRISALLNLCAAIFFNLYSLNVRWMAKRWPLLIHDILLRDLMSLSSVSRVGIRSISILRSLWAVDGGWSKIPKDNFLTFDLRLKAWEVTCPWLGTLNPKPRQVRSFH